MTPNHATPSPARSTLAQDLAEAGLTPEVEIRIDRKTSRRTTGFVLSCSEHGTLPIELRKKSRAVGLANRHRSVEHGGLARVVNRT